MPVTSLRTRRIARWCTSGLIAAAIIGAGVTSPATAGATDWSNGGGFPIQDNAYASSVISVSGMPNKMIGVTVSLKGLNHTYPADIDVLLEGPNGTRVMLMSDAPQGTNCADDATNVNLYFNDTAGGPIPNNHALVDGIYRPTNNADTGLACGNAPNDAELPVAPTAANLSAFNGTDPNGDWTLYVGDDDTGATGSVSNGWTLTISYASWKVTPDPIAFGDVAAGTSKDTVATITDTFEDTGTPPSNTSVTIGSVSNPSFSHVSNDCARASFVKNTTCAVNFRFQPTTAGPQTGTVTLTFRYHWLGLEFAETQTITLTGNGTGRTIIGTRKSETLLGTSGDDVIYGKGGNDKIFGGGGNDVIIGGAGNDKLYGEDGSDTLKGGAGRDKCDGGNGTDTAAKTCERKVAVP